MHVTVFYFVVLAMFVITKGTCGLQTKTLKPDSLKMENVHVVKLIETLIGTISALDARIKVLEPLLERVKILESMLQANANEGLAENVERNEARVNVLEPLIDRVQDLENLVVKKNGEIKRMKSLLSKDTRPEPGGYPLHSFSQHARHFSRGIRQAEQVAFTAVLSQHQQHLSIRQKVLFDRVLLNEGNGYSRHTGAFTAPVAGIYLFIYNFGHHSTGETFLELMKNGEFQNSAAVEGHFDIQNLQGGNAAVLRLNKGDVVWVDVFQVADVTLQAGFTTFCGALLW